MTATLDELLAGADRAEERDRDLPTREELMRQLEDALDELESRFPTGEPDTARGLARAMDGLEYQVLMLRISGTRLDLEGEEGIDYAVEARPALTALAGGRDAS